MSLGTLVLASCASGSQVGVKTLASPGAVPSGPVHGKAAAQVYAGRLLDALGFPPGSRQLGGAPPSALRGLSLNTSNLADRWRVVSVPGTASRLMAYLANHRPKGFVGVRGGIHQPEAGVLTPTEGPSHAGSTATRLHWYEEQLQAPPAGAGLVELEVAAVATGHGRVDARVDSLVDWLPPKSVAVQVPANDTVAIVSEDRQVGGRPTTRRVVVSDPASVNRLREAADGLSPAPHGIYSCPMIPVGLNQIVIAFTTSANAQPNLTFTVPLFGCRAVTVTEGGRHVGSLANDAALTAAYSAILNLPPAGRHSPT